tara:strand:- start:1231 stop:1629 length:399 start_codon:yes stop_codon:yes gene_type:complete
MITEAMITRAQALVDKNEVEYHHTDGNAHIFIGKGHNVSKDKEYEIKAEIQQDNKIDWYCDCHHAQFNDECKHMLACQILMNTMKLRDEYKGLSSDIDKHNDDEAVEDREDREFVKNKVIGMRAFKIESDDD